MQTELQGSKGHMLLSLLVLLVSFQTKHSINVQSIVFYLFFVCLFISLLYFSIDSDIDKNAEKKIVNLKKNC